MASEIQCAVCGKKWSELSCPGPLLKIEDAWHCRFCAKDKQSDTGQQAFASFCHSIQDVLVRKDGKDL